MRHLNRRQAAFAALSLAAAPSAFAQAGGPIKVGLLTIDSGPFATYANLIDQAAKTAAAILNAEGGAAERPFEVVAQTHNGTPAAAVAAATRLVQQSGVSLILGQTLSSHSMALVPKLSDLNVLFIDHYAESTDLMGKSCHPNYFRVSTPHAVTTKLMEDYVRSSGVKTWNLITPDYASGHSLSKSFQALVASLGGTVQQNLFAPIGTSDFGSYISQLARPADGLLVALFMSDGQSFAKQARQFGLFDKFKLVLGAGFATDFQLEAHGDNVLGVVNSLSWTPELPGDRNARYVREFQQIARRRPFYTDADVMAALEVFRAGVVKAGSTEPAKVRKALEGLKVDMIFGAGVEVRAADHHLIRQHGMAQVVKGKDGRNRFEMKLVKPGSQLYPEPSADCRAQQT